MKVEIFKAEDFEFIGWQKLACSQTANAKLSKWLAENGVRVFGHERAFEFQEHALTWHPEQGNYDTHSALLINIQKIEECKHPVEKVSRIFLKEKHDSYKEFKYFECECGAKVIPTRFEVAE